MVFSPTHLIIHFLLVFIPFVATLTFNLKNIGPSNQDRDIVTEGHGTYISNNGIHLTTDANGSDWTQKSGRATYTKQLHLWDNASGELASFPTSFIFVIDSYGRINYGDGLAFFLSQKKSDITRGGAMGLPINPTFVVATSKYVAVEFDTFWDDGWDPLVWDPASRVNTSMGDHVGVRISSLASVRSQKWLSDIPGGGMCQVWITYDSVSNNLSVSFTGYQNNRVVRQDGLVYMVDLRKELSEWVFSGFQHQLKLQSNRITLDLGVLIAQIYKLVKTP